MELLAQVLSQEIQRTREHLLPLEEMIKNKNMVITGGAGFVGTWLCSTLVDLGGKVTCLDNFSSSDLTNVDHLKTNPNFTLVKHDVTHSFSHLIPKDVDSIMHLASNASPFEFEHYPIAIIRANTLGLDNVLEVARLKDIPVLFTSTSEVYGDPPDNQIPTTEDYYGNVNPNGPRSCYDESKRCGEALLKAYEREYAIDGRIVRLFNTYGPYMRAGMSYGRAIPNFVVQALESKPITIFGTGKQTRSFTYITDEIEGLLKVAFLPKAKGQVFNLGNNKETTVLDLAKQVLTATNSSSPLKFEPQRLDDPKRRCPDISKVKKILGWEPHTDLQDGLKPTIKWFKLKLKS